jgi:arylsulfatase A-like enzyme
MRCSIPRCNPARAGVLTGQYAQGPANGIYTNEDSALPDPGVDSLPVWLDGVGSAMIGKYLAGLGEVLQPGWDVWRVLSGNEQAAHGFTVSVSDGGTPVGETPTGHQLTYLAGEVSSFITTATEPWFCWYAPTNPHINPLTLQNNPFPQTVTKFAWLRWPLDLLESTAGKPPWILNRPQFTAPEQSLIRRNVRQQVREVYDLDATIAGLYADLAQAGRLDDTFIIFITDSGVFYGEQRLGNLFASTKNHPYDTVSKVPCIVRGPGVPAGVVASTPTVLQDVTSTILAVFGASATVSLDGVDLRELITTPDLARTTLYERKLLEGFPDGAGVVTIDRKLIRWADAYEFEAYDLDVDPAEHVNWSEHPGRTVELFALNNKLQALLDRSY